MAAMATALVEFADNGNSRTYTRTGHTPAVPKLVIQKRKVPNSTEGNSEMTVSVIQGTLDADGLPLSSKVVMDAIVRFPLKGASADITAVLAVFRDIVASDEFTAAVSSTNWVKA